MKYASRYWSYCLLQKLLSSLPHDIEDDLAGSQDQDVEMNCDQKDSSVSEGDWETETDVTVIAPLLY